MALVRSTSHLPADGAPEAPAGALGAGAALKVLVLVALAAGPWVWCSPATAEPVVRIHAVDATPGEEWATVSLTCSELFTRKSVSTLQSGLPGVVQLELRVQQDSGDHSLFGGSRSNFEDVHSVERVRTIGYDVWDERYTIRSPGDVRMYTDWATAEAAVMEFVGEPVIALTQLKENASYLIAARVQLVAVSPEQGEQLAAWLREARGASRAEPRGGTFELGFRDLMSVFWSRSRSRRSAERSDWHYSDILTISPSAEAID
jgi:hypothetical protein